VADVISRDLIASYWAIAGDAYPGAESEVSPFPIEERLEVAAKSGFTGVGMLHADILAIERTMPLAKLAPRLEELGLRHVELECLSDWFSTGDRRKTSDRQRADLLRAAEILGARHIKVNGDLARGEWPAEELAEQFASLCLDAAKVDAMVAIEFMPFSGVPDVSSALELVRAAGEPNGKLLVDIWHVARAGTPFEEIATVPHDLIAHVEIDDALAEPEGGMWNDTIHNRRLPGEGELDVVGFLSAIRETGYGGPIGVEVISSAHRVLPLREAAEACYRSATSVLEREAQAAGAPRCVP
jgi:sugar phosphate isomerase/epimerase